MKKASGNTSSEAGVSNTTLLEPGIQGLSLGTCSLQFQPKAVH